MDPHRGGLVSPPSERGRKGKREEISPLPLVIVFVTQPPSVFFCELHGGLLVSPVVGRCGHSFCRSCILTSIPGNLLAGITIPGTPPPLSSSSSGSTTALPLPTTPSSPSSPGFGDLQSQLICCPIDKLIMKDKHLVPNRALAAQIDDILIHCRYGLRKELIPLDSSSSSSSPSWVVDPDGCQEHIKLGRREEHEKSCGYGPTACPHCRKPLSGCQLQVHLKECKKVPCPHRVYGCNFSGSQQEVSQHLSSSSSSSSPTPIPLCNFEPIKFFLEK
jgi:hypothetical protein